MWHFWKKILFYNALSLFTFSTETNLGKLWFWNYGQCYVNGKNKKCLHVLVHMYMFVREIIYAFVLIHIVNRSSCNRIPWSFEIKSDSKSRNNFDKDKVIRWHYRNQQECLTYKGHPAKYSICVWMSGEVYIATCTC